MSKEYPCVYWNEGKCKKFSDDEVISWCVEGPCEYQTLSIADRIRAMDDEELYFWAKKQISCGSDFFPCGMVCDGACKAWDEEECNTRIMAWLKQTAEVE